MSSDNLETDLSLKAEINLYYDLSVPDGARKAPLMIAVHGYGAHKRSMMREARLVAPENFVIASVQGPHQHFRQTADGYRIGFGWLTEHKPEEYVRLHHDFVAGSFRGANLLDVGHDLGKGEDADQHRQEREPADKELRTEREARDVADRV